MKNSLFTDFFEVLKRDVLIGFIASVICVSVGHGLSNYYSGKIPENAAYTEGYHRIRGVEGEVDYDVSINYKNDVYNKYNTLSSLFFAFPLTVGIIIIALWEFQNWKLKMRLKDIEDAEGEEGLRKFKESLQYRYYKKSTFYNFSSGYFIGLVTLVVSALFYYVFQILLNLFL